MAIILMGLAASSAPAAFTSLHVFGDGLSCTATNPGAGPYYYGKRYSNGRVWVEVLAQQQGLVFNAASNIHSYFGNTSDKLASEINAYTPPADANNALVVIWVNNADLYYPALDPSPTIDKFNTVINLAVTNQFKAITSLYAKGIRTLIMPNVVDISTIPQFNNYIQYKSLLRQASLNYNTAFYIMLDQARAKCPGLNIVVPDYFALLQKLLSKPADYGLINPLLNQGNGAFSIDAMDDPALADKSLNGPGANYVFWDYVDPTAKVHYIMANMAQQLVSPVQITGLAQINGSNRLDLVNVPVGMNGFLDGSTNLASAWTSVANFNSPTTTTSIFVVTPPLPANFGAEPGSGGSGGPPVPGAGSGTTSTTSTNSSSLVNFNLQLYRVRFPYAWVWP
ncbi:MAG TPA: SGNH/GDSL hydrolase family protein [bacterium]|nr:SGNH/GDSL hydrolase family protein [bacterium]